MEIKKLNELYQNALNMTKIICDDLTSCKIKHKLGFYNNHEVSLNGEFVKEIYPIPVISCSINNIKIDIGFDIATNVNHPGFLELTLSKDEILKFNFDNLKNYNFDIYGFKNFKEDYYFNDIEKAKQKIKISKESKFHIGMDFSSLKELDEILTIFKSK